WYILTAEFALPHARPDEGVLSPHSVLSLVCCAEAVAFPDHPDVRLIIVLAAADSEQHIQTIQRLVCWLDEGDRLHRLTRVEDQSQLDAL
ncbi:PTS sugar transporter subunit IIA, partial [Klebsiella pneumoniae]|nr:PTS sugar transporter subunit IIA [Klebsiella pneumoniae]